MSSTLPIVRTLTIRPPARHSACYHVVLPSAERPIELGAAVGRDRLCVDAITALFVGSLPLQSLAAHEPGSAAPLVIEIPSSFTDRWALPDRESSLASGRVFHRRVVMSPAALLLAQRLRRRPDTDTSEAFLDELISDLFDAAPADTPRQSSLRLRALVDRTRRRLAEAPGSPHPLPELAEWLGVSAFHFARVFRSETGLSVHQYLLRLRMAGALRHLSCYKTDLSRLALELGFSSHSHFTATFRKEFGVSPAHVRSLLDGERRCAGVRYLPWPANHHADGTQQNHSA